MGRQFQGECWILTSRPVRQWQVLAMSCAEVNFHEMIVKQVFTRKKEVLYMWRDTWVSSESHALLVVFESNIWAFLQFSFNRCLALWDIGCVGLSPGPPQCVCQGGLLWGLGSSIMYWGDAPPLDFRRLSGCICSQGGVLALRIENVVFFYLPLQSSLCMEFPVLFCPRERNYSA